MSLSEVYELVTMAGLKVQREYSLATLPFTCCMRLDFSKQWNPFRAELNFMHPWHKITYTSAVAPIQSHR